MTSAQRFDGAGDRRDAHAGRAAVSLETAPDAALVDRLQVLRPILPGMATQVAIA